MDPLDRYCPLCEDRLSEQVCPTHQIPTVPAALVEDATRDLPKDTVLAGRYRIDGLIGSGGMGQVYAATQLAIQRAVAIKTLRHRLVQDPSHLRRFYREARAASLLDGPNIVRVYDFGVDEATSTPFIAMELVRGTTLREYIAILGRVEPLESAAIAAQVCRALLEAKAAGIVHRDLKSDNILLAPNVEGGATVKVMDFGVAKLDPEVHGETGSLTESGALLGTPRTMAPEQILGKAVDWRADLYALGCVLHEMLTGEAPFVGEDLVAVVNQQISVAPPAIPADLGVPPGLVRLRDALLEKDRERRPADLAGLLRELLVLAGDATPGSAGRWSEALAAGPGRAAPASPDAATVSERGARSTVRPAALVGAAAPSRRWALVAAGAVLAAAVGVWAALGGGAAGEGGGPAPGGRVEDAPRRAGVSGAAVSGDAAGGAPGPRVAEDGPSGAGPMVAAAGPDTRVAEERAPDAAGATSGGSGTLAEDAAADTPARVHLTVSSSPAGHAFRGGEDLGETPVEFWASPDELPMELTIRREGYEPRTVTLDARTLVALDLPLTPKQPARRPGEKRRPPGSDEGGHSGETPGTPGPPVTVDKPLDNTDSDKW